MESRGSGHRSASHGQPWSIRVAAIAADAPAREVYRAPRGEGGVFHALSSDTQLFWTTGGRLIFPAESDGWLHLYAIASAGGKAQLLTPGNFEIEYAASTPNGGALIYAGNSGDIDRRHLWKLSFPSGELVPLTSGTGIETMPVVASDGVSIARQPVRPGHGARCLADQCGIYVAIARSADSWRRRSQRGLLGNHAAHRSAEPAGS
jgi:hypothetical protein